MADKAVVMQTTLDAIGQAIIDKGGATEAMTPAQMPAAIAAIPSGGEPLYAPAMFDDVKMTQPEWFEDGKVHIWVDFDLDPREDTIGIYIGANSVGCVEVDWGDGTIESNTAANGYGIDMAHTYDKERDENQFVITIALKNGVTRTRYGYANNAFVKTGNLCAWAVEITYNGGDQGGAGDGYDDTSICLYNGLRFLKVSGTNFRGAHSYLTLSSTLRDIITSIYTGTRNVGVVSYLPITRVPDWLVWRGTLGFSSFLGCRQLREVKDSLFDGVSLTNCQNMFYNCSSLLRVPDTLDLSACTNCYGMFSNCSSLLRVPDTLDLSALTTTTGNFLGGCSSLVAIPTHVTIHYGLNLSQSLDKVSKDSIATFDENGNVNGGFVGNLNTKKSSTGTQTMQFSAAQKNKFTADEWTAVKTCLTDKGWAVTPA